jgi:hypothetical protein
LEWSGMRAAHALKAALAAGVEIRLDGDDLVLEASTEPPAAVLDALSRHKAEILLMLRPCEDDWTSENWQSAFNERASIIEFDGGAPRAWAEALARLDPAHPPCDIPQKRWVQFIDDCGRFLDGGWAPRAEALGWGPLDLFGCDRHKPYARVDRAGLLWLLNGRTLLALTANTAAIATATGGSLTFRRIPNEPGRVLAWELASDSCRDGLCAPDSAQGGRA